MEILCGELHVAFGDLKLKLLGDTCKHKTKRGSISCFVVGGP